MKKPCMQCGASFDAKYDYHRLCWGCWKKGNPSAITYTEKFDLEKSRLLDEIEYWKGEADSFEHISCALAGKINQIKKENAELRQSKKIDDEMLKRLIQLCHPDKHNGKESAKLATQWLVQQRKVQ